MDKIRPKNMIAEISLMFGDIGKGGLISDYSTNDHWARHDNDVCQLLFVPPNRSSPLEILL